MMAADEYCPCLKCNVWVPYYAKEIHMAECHELMLSQFSHPYITGSVLFGQVILVGKVQQSQEVREKDSKNVKSALKNRKSMKKQANESNRQIKKDEKSCESKEENESGITEPEWLKKILSALHYRVILVNEKDLIRCDILAYSPVEVKVGGTSCGFLVIPEERVKIGHIMVHQGSARYLPELKGHSLICVKKIYCVQYVDELILMSDRAFTNEEKLYFEKQVKAFLYSSYPLGAPFTMNAGSKIYLPSLNSDETTFTVESYKLGASLDNYEITHCESRKDHNLTNEESNTIPSQLLTIDECGGSITSFTDKISKLQISTPLPVNRVQLEETGNSTNFEANIFTSTPKRSVQIEGSECNISLSSKVNARERSPISEHVRDTGSYILPEKFFPWVRTGMNTKVVLQAVSDRKGDRTKVIDQNEYCKDQVYCTLKKIMEAALRGTGLKGSSLLGQWSGVLLYGPPGTGKTSMVHKVSAELNVPLFTLTLASVSKSSRGPKEHIQHTFRAVCKR